MEMSGLAWGAVSAREDFCLLGMTGGKAWEWLGRLNTSPSSAENGKAQSQEKTPKELAVALQTLPSSQGGGIWIWGGLRWI